MFNRQLWSLVSLLFTLASAVVVVRGGGGPTEPFFYKGFDLSSLKIEEDGGAIYKDTLRGNTTRPVEDMLVGMNTVRLRLWVNPKVPYDGGYYETYNLQYVMALAKRFHSKGYRIYLDYR
jgi:arabinogalactan endo-1,4-beta-galactosidase